MANENTKYTHRIEKCCQLLKALCYVTLERYTGDTLSCAYWRLREGKGLLTYEDKRMLDVWSKQITKVRRYCSSPVALPISKHKEMSSKRNELLDRMETYRDWLSYGSKPLYLTDLTHHDYSAITLEMAVSHLFPEISQADVDTQKEFWQSHHFKEILEYDDKIFNRLSPIFENSDSIADAILTIMDNTDLRTLPYDKVWQIRTDMERRSSINARINSIMNWMFMVLDRCTSEHKKIIENNERIIDEFISWKMKTKESLKAKETIKDNCYEIISELISKIQVPEPPKQADTETTTL